MTPWKQLTIYIGESDHWHNQPLHIALIELARRRGMAGATATRGIEGFGKNATIHTTNLLALSSDLPIVVTIIDQEDAIAEILPSVQEMVKQGLITLKPVEVFNSDQSLQRDQE